MRVKTDFGTYEVTIRTSKYRTGDNLAIMLMEADGPFATITVNLPAYTLTKKSCAFVDTNNCPWAPEFIKEYKLGTNTGFVGYSGYCEYPLYEFDLDRLSALSEG